MKKRRETILEFETVFEPDRVDGGYVVTVPKMPGLVTEGDTLSEARRMAKDAIRCYLEGVLKELASPAKNRGVRSRKKLARSV